MPRVFDPAISRHPRGKYGRVLSCMRQQNRRTQMCPDAPRLDGKLAMVTGGTGGIGAEIVKGLARRGAEVVVAARGGEDTAALMADWTDDTGGRISFLPMDLGDLAATRNAVGRFEYTWRGRPLDILCANAGISPKGHSVSKDGVELAFAVNCLGHHLLIRGLMDAALFVDNARIVGTTGDIYILADDCTPDFTYKGHGLPAYCRSKLGNLWQYQELARRHPELHVVIIHPGVVASGLEGPTTGVGGAVKRMMMLSPELGAQASLIGATQDGLQSGDYFHNTHGKMILGEDDPAADVDRAHRFWNTLERLCGDHLARDGDATDLARAAGA